MIDDKNKNKRKKAIKTNRLLSELQKLGRLGFLNFKVLYNYHKLFFKTNNQKYLGLSTNYCLKSKKMNSSLFL